LHEVGKQEENLFDDFQLTIDRIYSLARETAPWVARLPGGGGGFMLLYCDEENQPAVRNAFLKQGIREMRFAFDFEGSRVLVNDPFIGKGQSLMSGHSSTRLPRE